MLRDVHPDAMLLEEVVAVDWTTDRERYGGELAGRTWTLTSSDSEATREHPGCAANKFYRYSFPLRPEATPRDTRAILLFRSPFWTLTRIASEPTREYRACAATRFRSPGIFFSCVQESPQGYRYRSIVPRHPRSDSVESQEGPGDRSILGHSLELAPKRRGNTQVAAIRFGSTGILLSCGQERTRRTPTEFYRCVKK